MAKITISSTRVYYRELPQELSMMIHHDILMYQSQLHKSYKELYNNHLINPKYLKEIYHTNDYFPLSSISEAKGILKSQKTWYKKSISHQKKTLQKIIHKIKKEEHLLKQYEMTLHSLIYYSKALKNHESLPPIYKCLGLSYQSYDQHHCIYKGRSMSLYIFEVQYLKPLIKRMKNRIKLLKYRKTRREHLIVKIEKKMKAIYFHKRNYMKITGRAQGKYCNNLFKYDC